MRVNTKRPVMKRTQFTFILSTVLIAILYGANGGESNMQSIHEKALDDWMFTTPAYNREALRLVIQEANRVAEELHLPLELPIAETNILRTFITPYAMSRHTFGSIGNVTTSNYTYCVSIDGKFSYLERSHQDQERLRWTSEYSQPISRVDTNTGQQVVDTNAVNSLLDTNTAYQLATQWLAEVSMDVKGLSRDCHVYIQPTTVWGHAGTIDLLPLYSVCWMHGLADMGNVKAYVELFLPTKTLVELRVEDSQYILRKPLQLTNLDYLLWQTSVPAMTNPPVKQ